MIDRLFIENSNNKILTELSKKVVRVQETHNVPVDKIDKSGLETLCNYNKAYVNSFETVLSKASHIVKEGLDAGREICVLIDKTHNKIIGKFDGGETDVSFSIPAGYRNVPIITLHGHPDYSGQHITSSFSFEDIDVFQKTPNLIESWIMNSKGEYEILKKKADFKKLSAEQLELLEALLTVDTTGNVFKEYADEFGFEYIQGFSNKSETNIHNNI